MEGHALSWPHIADATERVPTDLLIVQKSVIKCIQVYISLAEDRFMSLDSTGFIICPGFSNAVEIFRSFMLRSSG